MQGDLYQVNIQCPYCWEVIEISVDDSDEGQQYIEDCQVCCRPINIIIGRDFEGRLSVDARRDDE